MESHRFESASLVIAAVGVAVLGVGAHTVAAAVGNIAILLVLFAGNGSIRSGAQSLGFASVAGLSILAPLFWLAANVLGANPPSDSAPWLFCGVWAAVTVIMFGVDRFRMSGRESIGLAGTGIAASSGPIVTSAPTSSYRPAPIRVEAIPVTAQPTPAQTYVPPQAYTPPQAFMPPQEPPAFNLPSYNPPAYKSPAYPEPLSSEAVVAPEMSIPQTMAAMPISAAAAQPDVLAIPPGRETMIYLNLIGEGLNVLRTVRAENLGRDHFRIADVMPQGEQWEFTPGQVVKCRKKALSNGKQMVAYEEAARAQ